MSKGAPIAITVPLVRPHWMTSSSASKMASIATSEAMVERRVEAERGEAVVADVAAAPGQRRILCQHGLGVEERDSCSTSPAAWRRRRSAPVRPRRCRSVRS